MSCSHRPAGSPDREVAAVTELSLNYGDIDHKKSSVKLFPPEFEGGYYKYYFYVELKDQQNKFVDCDPGEIVLKNDKGALVNFELERLFTGRYYVIVEAPKQIVPKNIHFSVRDKPIQEKFRLVLQGPPVLEKSGIRMLVKENHQVTMQLILKDANGRPATLGAGPEVILEGDGFLGDVVQMKDGIWEFTINYSEQNHIMYISVRAQGVYFHNLYRFQHVEK